MSSKINPRPSDILTPLQYQAKCVQLVESLFDEPDPMALAKAKAEDALTEDEEVD